MVFATLRPPRTFYLFALRAQGGKKCSWFAADPAPPFLHSLRSFRNGGAGSVVISGQLCPIRQSPIKNRPPPAVSYLSCDSTAWAYLARYNTREKTSFFTGYKTATPPPHQGAGLRFYPVNVCASALGVGPPKALALPFTGAW